MGSAEHVFPNKLTTVPTTASFDAKEPAELSFPLIRFNQSFENENDHRLLKSAVHTHSLHKTSFWLGHSDPGDRHFSCLRKIVCLLSDCEPFPLRESNIYLNKLGFEAWNICCKSEIIPRPIDSWRFPKQKTSHWAFTLLRVLPAHSLVLVYFSHEKCRLCPAQQKLQI